LFFGGLVDELTMRQRVATARVGRLATVRPDGRPHVVVCCFVLAGPTAYSVVDDKPKTTTRLQRLRNVESHPAVSLLVDHYDDDWSTLWWVRLDGIGRILVEGDDRDHAVVLLVEKYPQYQASRPDGPVLALDITDWRAWP
jgi:PPOX class probable F420-dependent enzyme